MSYTMTQVTAWYTEKLNYEYDPLVHGNTAEWLSDLVSISFDEPPKYFKRSMRCIKVTPVLCKASALAFVVGSQVIQQQHACALICMAGELHVSFASCVKM